MPIPTLCGIQAPQQLFLSTLTQVEPVAHSLQRESILAAVVPFCYPVTENCLALLMPFQIIGVLDWPEVKRGVP